MNKLKPVVWLKKNAVGDYFTVMASKDLDPTFTTVGVFKTIHEAIVARNQYAYENQCGVLSYSGEPKPLYKHVVHSWLKSNVPDHIAQAHGLLHSYPSNEGVIPKVQKLLWISKGSLTFSKFKVIETTYAAGKVYSNIMKHTFSTYLEASDYLYATALSNGIPRLITTKKKLYMKTDIVMKYIMEKHQGHLKNTSHMVEKTAKKP